MDFYIGQILMGGWNYAPQGTELCAGQILQIGQNQALFALLGTTFGGNGQSNFALPDMRGRVPMGQGAGPNLTPRVIGQQGGVENVTLTVNQMPSHNHVVDMSGALVNIEHDLQITGEVTVGISDSIADSNRPEGNALARRTTDSSNDIVNVYDNAPNFGGRVLSGVEHSLAISGGLQGKLAGSPAMGNTGGNQPHDNMQPFLCVTFVVVTQGMWPSRP